MAKITVAVDCGNAPRKEFLKTFHTAIANGAMDLVMPNISEDVHWETAGGKTIAGKDDFEKAIQEHSLWRVKELRVDAIITHGNDASVNGKVVSAGGLPFSFCNVYKFKGFKGTVIKTIQTYLIQEKENV